VLARRRSRSQRAGDAGCATDSRSTSPPALHGDHTYQAPAISGGGCRRTTHSRIFRRNRVAGHEKSVAAVFRTFSPEDQARIAIIASNYGEAAALDVYGRTDGLPLALSGHNRYWLWGPGSYDGSLILNVGGSVDRWKPLCRSLEVVGTFGGEYVMPYENNRPIFICRDLRMPLPQLWSRLKRYR
jgi:hypothetical protein